MSQTPYQQLFPAGKALQIAVPPIALVEAKNYMFNSWDDSSTETTREIVLDRDISLTANYLLAISLTVASSVGGSVTPVPGTYYYPVGPVYVFTALPEYGYTFDHWDLDGENKGSDPQLHLTILQTMNGKTLTAIFTQTPPQTITLNIAVSGNGTTDIAPGMHTFNVGDTVTFTATPLPGESFIQWTLNGFSDPAAVLVLQISEDMNGKTLIANFTSVTAPTSSNYLFWLLIGLAAASLA